MADQLNDLRRIDWQSWFPFTRIFKCFSMARQPSKLGLALAGVLLMGIWGYLLDGIWRMGSSQPTGPEIWAYWQTGNIDAWRRDQEAERFTALQRVYGPDGVLAAQAPKDARELRKPEAVDKALKQIKPQYKAEAAQHLAKKAPGSAAAAVERYARDYQELAAHRSRGIFTSFMKYEQEAVGHFLDEARDVLMLDWTSVAGGTDEVVRARQLGGELRRPGDFGEIGMIGSVLLMLRGVQWMLAEHFIYALLFLLGTLAIWSIFGGAICRISALQAARDEEISFKTALDFSVRKFFAFFSAPLVPLAAIAIIAVLLMAGGLVTSIWYVGEIVGPLLLGLGLAGGLAMTLFVVGAIGGGSLLWPTIGVEGSDAFDAMSRSFSYFYQRPWRFAFYSIVAAIYGAVSYIVLRYFVFLLLWLTRYWTSVGASLTERPGTGYIQGTKVDAMWPRPTVENLMGDGLPLFGTIHWESFGAVLIGVWVLLVVLLLCAFLVSFYFSASTIIYLLLRQRVDATDFEDVYTDDEEEPGLAAPVPPAPSGTAPAAGETPPVTPPGGSSMAPPQAEPPTA